MTDFARRGRADGLLTLAVVGLALVVGAFVSSLVYRWRELPLSPGAADGGSRTAPRPDIGAVPAEAGDPGVSDTDAPVLEGAHGGRAGPSPAAAGPSAANAGVDRGRIRVEVLNGAGVPGLADRMTRLLRSRGFDVVDYGNAEAEGGPSAILDRVGDADLAREVALELPGTPIRYAPDSERFIDVTVLVGADYERFFSRAPARDPAAERSSLRRILARARDALGL